MPIFEVDNLQLHYLTCFSTKIPAVVGVSFSIEQAEVLGIASESGCGKSTLVNGYMVFFIPAASPEDKLKLYIPFSDVGTNVLD